MDCGLPMNMILWEMILTILGPILWVWEMIVFRWPHSDATVSINFYKIKSDNIFKILIINN